MRRIVLDTETTGLQPKEGHRIIEVGCIEMLDRRISDNQLHFYLNPDRAIDDGAKKVHGITEDFLQDKPHFAEIADELFEFIKGAELIIHNAPFDMGFLNHEFKLYDKSWTKLEKHCEVFDTLTHARRLHPGQKNNLDALCKRYQIESFNRKLHGALLDAEILAWVYLAMTGGQGSLFGDDPSMQSADEPRKSSATQAKTVIHAANLKVIKANTEELSAHEAFIKMLEASKG